MKRLYLIPLLLLFVIALATQGQENKKKQLWYCYVETVHPPSIFEYQEMSKELAQLAKDNNFPFSFHIWASPDLDYEIWYPINSLNDIEVIDEAWDDLMDQWGEEKSMAFQHTKTRNNSFTMETRYDLSYQPATVRPEIDNAEYLQYQEFHLLPGKQKEVEALIKEANQMLAEHNYNDPWYVGKPGIGMETPCIVAWSYGKDRDDYYIQDKKFREELGELFQPFNKKFVTYIDHVKTGEVYYKKEFSYEKTE